MALISRLTPLAALEIAKNKYCKGILAHSSSVLAKARSYAEALLSTQREGDSMQELGGGGKGYIGQTMNNAGSKHLVRRLHVPVLSSIACNENLHENLAIKFKAFTYTPSHFNEKLERYFA